MDSDQNSGASSRDRQVQEAWSEHRLHLVRVAARILGSSKDAEDVVQEAFGRLSLTSLEDIGDLRGWLTVAVRRLCIDRMRSAPHRRETSDPLLDERTEHLLGVGAEDPAERLTLDDQVRLALGHVLDRLTPAERTSFVLHDLFGFPFDAVGEMVGRSAAACRQLASRARHAIRTRDAPARRAAEEPELQSLAERFISACGGGDLDALLAVLDPAVDGQATLVDGRVLAHVHGAHDAAAQALRILGPRSGMQLVPLPVEDRAGVVALRDGRVVAVVRLDERNGRISHMRAIVRLP